MERTEVKVDIKMSAFAERCFDRAQTAPPPSELPKRITREGSTSSLAVIQTIMLKKRFNRDFDLFSRQGF